MSSFASQEAEDDVEADSDDDEMLSLRLLIQQAIEEGREMSLDSMIEKALKFGNQYPWPEELAFAQECLRKMTELE